MTKQQDFKQTIRARMAKTGESYSAARASLLAANGGYFPGYPAWGGDDIDIAVTAHALQYIGIKADAGPYSEAMLFGLSGGPGFAYFVFEYKGHPPTMTLMMRKNTMPGELMSAMLPRTGAAFRVLQTTSAKKAETQLEQALLTDTAVLCTVGQGGLGYTGAPDEMAAMAPQQVAVVGLTDTHAFLDDRAAKPVQVTRTALAAARAGYRKAKHRLIAFDGQDTDHDLKAAIRDAIRECVTGYTDAPYPRYAASFGLRAMLTMADALTADKGKRRWGQIFATGAKQALGRFRIAECLHHEYTSRDGGRPLYAAFLREAAPIVGDETLHRIADGFDRAAPLWRRLADLAVTTDDPGLSAAVEAHRKRYALIRAKGHEAHEEAQALYAEQQAGIASSALPWSPTAFTAMADTLRQVHELESDLVQRLANISS